MTEHKAVYPYSFKESIRNNEHEQWRESYKENCDCARAIERAINEHYSENILHNCIKSLIKQYGFNRVNWVLANTVQYHHEDGRYSEDNKCWAKDFHIPNDDMRWHFSVESHPGLTNLVINEARKVWKELGLFDHTHCLSENDGELDYTGKVVVINPNIFKDEYKTPEDQLFFAESGFGCHPNSRGQKVFGKFLKDGEETHYKRTDIIGVLKDEYLPKWAKEKLDEIAFADENESDDITMGGL